MRPLRHHDIVVPRPVTPRRWTRGFTRFLVALAMLSALSSCSGDRGVPADVPRGAAAEDAGPQPLVTVPFDDPRNQIVVQVEIDGRSPFNFLLDTATDPSGFDLTTADSLGIPVDRASGGFAVGTGSDEVVIYPVSIGGLSVGGVAFDTLAAMSSGIIAMLGERLGIPLHGVLGVSFLHDKAVVIDYPNRRVSIYGEALPVPEGPDVVSMAMERNGNDIVIPDFRVNGHPLRVTLDTGSSLTLSVYGAAAERTGLDALREGARVDTVRGFRGAATTLTATVDSIGVGPLTMVDAEVSFPDRVGETDGNLGNGYLKAFVLTLDYIAGRVTLRRP